ncbi:hypothetical protein [Actinocorallia aurantiaca]|uniref:Uncharacterized protein n=1 Tax=Actinocorallia aurantiaca TaxID=46204 RepID=A0ABP6H3G5_9ACTN
MLDLLRRPQELYERLDGAERRLLTQTIFTKLYIDEERIAGDELMEPFSDLIAVSGASADIPQPQQHVHLGDQAPRCPPGPQQRNSAPADRSAVIAGALLNRCPLSGRPGSNKASWMRRQGLEPRTR